MESDSIREDIGYMKYELNKSDTYKGRADKVKIEYLSGPSAGQAVIVRRDFAEEQIAAGNAKEV